MLRVPLLPAVPFIMNCPRQRTPGENFTEFGGPIECRSLALLSFFPIGRLSCASFRPFDNFFIEALCLSFLTSTPFPHRGFLPGCGPSPQILCVNESNHLCENGRMTPAYPIVSNPCPPFP